MILLTYLEDPLYPKLIIIITIKILKLITIIIKVFQVVISTLILISENSNNNSKDPILTLLNPNKNLMFPLKISLKMILLKNYKNNLMMEVYLL